MRGAELAVTPFNRKRHEAPLDQPHVPLTALLPAEMNSPLEQLFAANEYGFPPCRPYLLWQACVSLEIPLASPPVAADRSGPANSRPSGVMHQLMLKQTE
jgi:hypothetical protein